MKNKRILIAGGAGYIGCELVKQCLDKGIYVICLDLLIYGNKSINQFNNQNNFRLIKGDIRDWNLIKEITKEVDYVVNLAAIVGDKQCEAAPKPAIQINSNGNSLLAEASKKNNVKKYIFASTCSNYGISNPESYADEESFLNPVSLYAETKIDSEKNLKEIADEKFSTTSLRFATAFGISKRTRFDLIVNSLAYEALFNKNLVIFSEKTWRPYIHIIDMVKIIFKILELDSHLISGHIFNAGITKQNYTKKKLVDTLIKLLPETKVTFITSVDDRRDYRVSFKKIEELIDLKKTLDIKDGFKEIISAFNTNHLNSSDFNSNNLDTITEFFRKNESRLVFDGS